MILATYNLRSGGTRRVHWAKIFQEFRPDLFLVQETASPAEHLPPEAHPESAKRVAWCKAKGRRWGNAVYVGRGKARPVELPGYHGLVVGMKVTGAQWPGGSSKQVQVFSVHAPTGPGSYQRSVNQILDMIAKQKGRSDVVIGGDFNLTVGVRQAFESRITSKADLAILRRLNEEFGLVNCWQAANPGKPLPQTCRWTGNPSVPYHCDGLFVPRAWESRLRACEVVSSPEWDKLSDHNPVVAWFDE